MIWGWDGLVSPTLGVSLPSGSQRLEVVRQLALERMAAHGLHEWSFGFNRRKRTLGVCFFHRRTIELSMPFVERNGPDEIRDTVLHEIAHALVGPGHGHDAVWKRKCLEVGAKPVRCGQAEMPEGCWQARCKGCGQRFHWHRKPKRMKDWFCRPCGAGRGKLVWQQTG
jgi:predicted SprT family Zn-dependent metalloprotease